MISKRFLFTCLLLACVPFLQCHSAQGEPHLESLVQAGGENLFGQIKEKLITDTASNVFDWVFGDPDDAEADAHELDEHYAYLKNDKGDTLSQLANAAGIKPEFLNFKAHDYDGNDKIDGLELMALILNEKVSGAGHHHHHGGGSAQNQPQLSKAALEQQMELGSKIIDRLLLEEDFNKDGFLDFTEYSNARLRLAGKA